MIRETIREFAHIAESCEVFPASDANINETTRVAGLVRLEDRVPDNGFHGMNYLTRVMRCKAHGSNCYCRFR